MSLRPISARQSAPLTIALTIIRLAYRGGVTVSVTAPSGSFVRGSSTAFSLGAPNVLGNGSIQSDVAVHLAITKNSAQSVSTQIAGLRTMLLGKGSDAMLSRVRAVCCLVPLCRSNVWLISAFACLGYGNPGRRRK